MVCCSSMDRMQFSRVACVVPVLLGFLLSCYHHSTSPLGDPGPDIGSVQLAVQRTWDPAPAGCAKQGAAAPRTTDCSALLRRVVFSLTTIPARIDHVKPVLEAILMHQSRPPDAVYLSVGPAGVLPAWLASLEASTGSSKILRVLQHDRDPGPGLKLLGAVHEELMAGRPETLIVYGDDDIVYGKDIIRLHAEEQHRLCRSSGGQPAALGPRRINAGSRRPIPVLEAGGSISVPAAAVPCGAFAIGDAPEACKFSDDYFLAREMGLGGLRLEQLHECHMDWASGGMDSRCLRQRLPHVEAIDALSRMTLNRDGSVKDRSRGDWRTQLERYKTCERLLLEPGR